MKFLLGNTNYILDIIAIKKLQKLISLVCNAKDNFSVCGPVITSLWLCRNVSCRGSVRKMRCFEVSSSDAEI